MTITRTKGQTAIYKTLRRNQEKFEDINVGKQNPYIEEGQTTQLRQEKGQKDKQRSTKHYAETRKGLKISMWVIRTRKTKRDRQYNGETEKGQTMMDKTLRRK